MSGRAVYRIEELEKGLKKRAYKDFAKEETKMSQENARKFMELLNRDEGLQEKLTTAKKAYTGDKTDERAAFETIVAPVAKEAGYEFSYEELESLTKSSGDDELSEDELAFAAGGMWYECVIFGKAWDHPKDYDWGDMDYAEGSGTCNTSVGVGFGHWWQDD